MVKHRSPKPRFRVRVAAGPPNYYLMKNKKHQFFLSLLASVVIVILAAHYLSPVRSSASPDFFRSCLAEPKFEDYEVKAIDWYLNKAKSVDFSGHPEVVAYRSIIRSAVIRGVNFAGKYVVVEWGCGHSCQNHAIINAETGKIVATNLISNYGAEFRKNSTLLVLNPNQANFSAGNSTSSETTYFYLQDDKLLTACR